MGVSYATMLTVTSGITSSSERWFSLLGKLNSLLRAKANETDADHKPVRVAVLDTGIQEHYKSLIQNRYKDYVSNNHDAPIDISVSSHGTKIVRLILKTFKDAEIYVARVFEQDKIDDDELVMETQKRIAEVAQIILCRMQRG
jgi:hypothetical protein